ncbi:YraN family protein [Leisingera sp. McT4-56]|uniref:YraN family protein n=1 Tax=Leisingera sp. McT4-56 TaxID=2881255 RepID=UPI001CF83284|nr:YraN family protein [Leisingera sp. McT4-56]MCB4456048.1 YraN family protein [Leisingera sp. McT4-56]
MTRARQHRGARAHLAGEAAEEIVARHYENRGYSVAERRWRGPGGEIDLILRGPGELVFVEVKHSATSASAARRITPRQAERIYASAGQYLEYEPQGQLTPVRFDAALVDGSGAVEIIENAFGMD